MIDHPDVIRPADHARWQPDKMGKSTLFESPRILVGLNAFEPGQVHARIARATAPNDGPRAVLGAPGERDARPAGGGRRDGGGGGGARQGGLGAAPGPRPGSGAPPANNALADAFARAKRGG